MAQKQLAATARATRRVSPYQILRSVSAFFLNALIVLAWLSCASPTRAEKVEQLKPVGYVNDYAGVLGGEAVQQINALCAEVDQKAHAQIAVVTIRSLEGDTVEDFANRLFQQWGVGPKPENRGVLILLAIAERRYRVEVGYGLEPILPDGKVGGFGREMVPRLRQNDYDAAFLLLTHRIAEVIAEDRGISLSTPAWAPRRARYEPGTGFFDRWLAILLLWLFFGGLFPAILAGLRAGRRVRRYGGWWMVGPWLGGWGRGAGSWGGGGFGGGGFGGFGGGLSGGGGASGSW